MVTLYLKEDFVKFLKEKKIKDLIKRGLEFIRYLNNICSGKQRKKAIYDKDDAKTSDEEKATDVEDESKKRKK
jgi:HSP90 family molecular chaperone